ncbi:hypothetical protein ABIC83_002640 [Roseateles asaccharophilus]|uniref:hypothetical protein n=1 Tax=Roseateles asaccharophilus TaxID=582607 RepID=UPI003837A888
MEQKRTQLFAPRTGNRPETFAITVKGYNTTAPQPFVTGTRIDTGEDVNVYLRQDVKYKRGSHKRSEIKDFAATRKDRQHPGTQVGGTLLVQEAFKQPDGTFGARWIQSLSHAPGEAQVFIATAHVSQVRLGKKSQDFPEGRPYAQMTVLHDGNFAHLDEDMAAQLKLCKPFQVNNIEELQQALTELLTDDIGVGVRVIADDGFDAKYVAHRSGDDPVVSVGNFMKDIGGLTEMIDAGTLRVEVIPYTNIWAGPKTTEAMVKNPVMAGRVGRFNVQQQGDQGPYNVPQYRPTIVAVRFNETKETAFFSHFEPLITRQPSPGLVNALAHAQTELLAPEVPKPDAPENTSTEPEAGDEYRGFSADTDDDLVGAVGGGDIPGGEDFDEGAPAPAAPAANDPAPAPAAATRRWGTNRR